MDICLRVQNASTSRAYYEGLGFVLDEGDGTEGWAVVVKGNARIGLFEPQYQSDAVSLNFRGANIRDVSATLTAQGYCFENGPKFSADGAGSASLRDPDGHLIFLDTSPTELNAGPSIE